MNRLFHALIAGTIVLLSACAAKQLPPPQWTYEKDAIRLQIHADNTLNLYDNEAHTLLLCVYQLSDPNTFNQLSNDEDGLYELLECRLFGNGASAAKRLIIQPGQDLNLILDRADGARYVGLAAGYYVMEKDRMIKVIDIPEILEETGFIQKKRTRKPGHLDIELTLGAQQITTAHAGTIEGQ